MNDAYKNTLVLLILALLVAGAGSYYVYIRLTDRIAQLQEREKVLRLKESKLSDLFEKQAGSRKRAEQMKTRWTSRYKRIPDTLRTASVLRYINKQTRTGFESINLTFQKKQRRPTFSALHFRVQGQAFFVHLYQLLWQIEQGRSLFRISNLQIQRRNVSRPAEEGSGKQRFIMTKFSFDLRAYFGGMRGLSAPEPVASVPPKVLPPESPKVNPFYPVIMRELPPNSHDRINVEKDQLVSIVGQEAQFQRNGTVHQVREGERVYLGRITEVDPRQGRVIARLNKGGIYDRIVLTLNEGSLHQQAQGETQLSPIN